MGVPASPTFADFAVIFITVAGALFGFCAGGACWAKVVIRPKENIATSAGILRFITPP
jgi:hypothetical protein